MRRFILATCVVGFCVWGCSRPTAPQVANSGSPPSGEEVAGTPYGDLVIGNAISHDNLTIFPILSKTPKNDDRFITLDEGLAAGTVKVIEIGAEEGDANNAVLRAQWFSNANVIGADEAQDEEAREEIVEEVAEGVVEEAVDEIMIEEELDEIVLEEAVVGDVNKLMVMNTSGRPLYLMPGEVIYGGNQDRTIGQEVVIESSEKPVPVDVFCVERGRWGGRGVASTTAQLESVVVSWGGRGVASTTAQLESVAEHEGNLSLVVSQTNDVEELAKEAQRGKFIASVGQLNKDVRLAVQQDGVQTQVWEKIAKTNVKVGNDSDSGNFAAAYVSSEVAGKFEPFIKKLKRTGETKQIVGVAVAVNGKMLSVDVFESTPLFKKFWPKLLKSYALDAVAASSEEDTKEKPPAIAVEDCIAFLKDVETSEAETEELGDGQKIAKRRSSWGASFSYYDAKAAKAAGIAEENAAHGYGGGGLGGSVHTSVLAE